MADVIVFAGPCLPRTPEDRWRGLLEEVEVRPPARRGDVLTALADGPRSLVLLDGLYYTVPAVTHKELLYALDAGVRVIGAASMGALRAAEMEPFGMEGVGWVYERFREGHLVGDDEVAILHASREHGFRPLTLALVEVRWALERLGSPAGSAILVERLAGLPFTERDSPRVESLAREILGEAVAAQLMRRLTEGSVKRNDAEAALRRARQPGEERSRAGPEAQDPHRAHTEYLSHFREWDLRSGRESQAPAVREAWNVTQLLHPRVPAFVEAVRRRFVLASAAEWAGQEPGPEHVAGIVEELAPGSPLPEPEIRHEARLQARAERGRERFGGVEAAGRFLAGELHLGRRAGWPEIHELLLLQDDLIPPWAFVRAFSFTAALEPALAVAREATQIQRFHRESLQVEGRSIQGAVLDAVAAGLWGCPVQEVERHAARRGLFRSHGFTPGLRDAVDLVAVVERMVERGHGVNDYPRAKARLRETPVEIHPRSTSPELAFLGLLGESGALCYRSEEVDVMHAHKTQVTISEDHEVAVKLPEDFPSGLAEVIVLAENRNTKPGGQTVETPQAFIARGAQEGWLTPPTHRFKAPPPRKPVAPVEEILAELEQDREDR